MKKIYIPEQLHDHSYIQEMSDREWKFFKATCFAAVFVAVPAAYWIVYMVGKIFTQS